MKISLNELAQKLGGRVVGDGESCVQGLSPIDDIQANTLVFAEGEDKISIALASEAAALLVNDKAVVGDKPHIVVDSPYSAFIQLLNFFYPPIQDSPMIHPTAVIAPDVVLGKNVHIGPYVVIESGSMIHEGVVIKAHVSIGHQVVIGCNSVLHPHVTLYSHTKIGQNVIIHASSVVGSDGFGYQNQNGQHLKIPHVGRVEIEDDVEIGANTVIDRATLGATRIGRGTKIDNLVQVAHSVKLGEHNILCAFTGIAGSTTSGSHVIFAADVGVSDHVKIDSGVILGARAGVPPHKHLKGGQVYLGAPARPKDKALELELAVTRIPFMRKNIKSLSEKLSLLEKQIVEKD